MKRKVAWLSTAMIVAAAGCGAQPDPTLTPDAFVSRRPAVGPGSNEPIARSGPLTYDAQHPPVQSAPERGPISQVVKDVVESSERAGNAVALAPQTAPADSQPSFASTQPTGLTTAEYQVVGVVLAQVNDRPIYADRVLAKLEREFAAEAPHRDFKSFMAYAADQVSRQVSTLVNSEVEFAAAEKALKKEDRDLARALTVEWRKSQTRMSGGSRVLQDQKAAATGIDSDEAAQEEFVKILSEIYLSRKIYPLVQVSADDIRRYYQQNIAEYTTAASAQFRVIKIDFRKSGGREAAKAKAGDILARAKSGENFAELAGKINDDPTLMKNKGAVGENGQMPKGAYVVEPVENAVWGLHPGDLTEAIDTGDAYYIAKVEALHPGGTRPFSDPEVQGAINGRLEREQMDKLRQKELEQLRKNSIIVKNDGMDEVVMAMIMQRYPIWVRGGR